MSDAVVASGKCPPELERFVMSMARMVNNYSLYGGEHAVTVTSMEECYESLTNILEKEPEISLTVADKKLLFNGLESSGRGALGHAIQDRLQMHGVNSLIIKKGVGPDEFVQFVGLMGRLPDELRDQGGLFEAMKTMAGGQIQVRQINFRLVDADAPTGGPGGGPEAEGAMPPESAGPSVPAAGAVKVVRRRGGVSADVERLADAVMADVDMDAVEFGADQGELDSVAQRILTNLRKTYLTLRSGFNLESQKGRRAMAQMLGGLRQAIESRLPSPMSDGRSQVADALAALFDEATLESLLADYKQKSDGLDRQRRDLADFMVDGRAERLGAQTVARLLQSNGVDAGGLPAPGVGVSGEAGGGGPADKGGNGFAESMLGQRVREMVEAGSSDIVSQERMLDILAQVESEVACVVAAAEARILDLQASLASLGGESAPDILRDPRKMAETLTELVQELCQPLSVVTCAIDLVRESKLHVAGSCEDECLTLARSSTERIRTLVRHLVGIVGVPISLIPNELIRTALSHDREPAL